MASLSLCPQFEINLMSNREVIEFHLQLKSAKAHGKIYKKSNHTCSTIFCVIVYSYLFQLLYEKKGDRYLYIIKSKIQWNLSIADTIGT